MGALNCDFLAQNAFPATDAILDFMDISRSTVRTKSNKQFWSAFCYRIDTVTNSDIFRTLALEGLADEGLTPQEAAYEAKHNVSDVETNVVT